MNQSEMRRSMSAGIAFVVLFVAGVFVTDGNSPDIKDKDSAGVVAGKYVDTLSSSSHRTGLIIGAYLIVLAGIAFIWFTAGLRSRVSSTTARRMVSGLGILGAAAMTAGAMASAVVPGSVSFGDEPLPQNGDTIRILMDLFFPFLFVVFGLASAALIAMIAVAGRSSGLPSWIAYTGWLAVLGAILAVEFLPFALTLLWYLAVAIVGLSRPNVAPATERESAPALA